MQLDNVLQQDMEVKHQYNYFETTAMLHITSIMMCTRIFKM
jgi:hypothetical protein